jgi:hypothetical protein
MPARMNIILDSRGSMLTYICTCFGRAWRAKRWNSQRVGFIAAQLHTHTLTHTPITVRQYCQANGWQNGGSAKETILDVHINTKTKLHEVTHSAMHGKVVLSFCLKETNQEI